MSANLLYEKAATLAVDAARSLDGRKREVSRVDAERVAYGSIAALEATKDARTLETQDAVKEFFASKDGKNIVSEAVYEGTLRALQEHGRQN